MEDKNWLEEKFEHGDDVVLEDDDDNLYLGKIEKRLTMPVALNSEHNENEYTLYFVRDFYDPIALDMIEHYGTLRKVE